MKSGWRLASVGLFMASLFGILVLRLWFLQVTDVASFLNVAETNQLDRVTIEAPRGNIYDRDGKQIMAGSVASLRVVVNRKLVPADEEDGLILNLSGLLGIPSSEVRLLFDERGSGARFPIGDAVSESMAAFVLENLERFPGVSVEPVPQRVYPLGESAAHVVGYIGAPSTEDLDLRVDITSNDRVGKFGVERSYDALLRGTPGSVVYRVNAQGAILDVVEETPPQPGGSVVTTIDLDLQGFVEDTLVSALALARQTGEEPKRAAAVVLDPRDGSVVAMASVPSFDPTVFSSGRLSQDDWDALSEKAAFNNFAIQGLYPPGSSFKTIVYGLALEDNIVPFPESNHQDIDTTSDPTNFFCDGQLLFQNTPPLNDWITNGHGLINISEALRQSCNLYFWSLARQIWEGRGVQWSENLLQDWAHSLGFGAQTGVDLPFEQAGLVPDREWFQYHQQLDDGVVRSEGGWAGGDLMNMATGQGALIVTPLQMAVAYGALVNGGTVWEPRVVSSVRDAANNVIFTNLPSAARKLNLKASTVLRLRNDLNGVVNSPTGTARTAFEGFCDDNVPDSECAALQQVGGKTGTAEIRQALTADDRPVDTAWFVGAAPLDDPQWVVAVVVDEGGSGGRVSAPAARRIFQYLMGEDPDPVRAGADTER